MRLIVNGIEEEIESPPLTSLLTVLREELGITSPKAGCEQGGCGTCTVLVDGEPRRSCLTAVAVVDGASITTVEGLGEAESLSPVQAAFHTHYAAQCGFCTPGARAGGDRADRAQGRRGRAGRGARGARAATYCRCTGYVKIVDAVIAASRGEVEPVADLPAAEDGRAGRAS